MMQAVKPCKRQDDSIHCKSFCNSRTAFSLPWLSSMQQLAWAPCCINMPYAWSRLSMSNSKSHLTHLSSLSGDSTFAEAACIGFWKCELQGRAPNANVIHQQWKQSLECTYLLDRWLISARKIFKQFLQTTEWPEQCTLASDCMQ